MKHALTRAAGPVALSIPLALVACQAGDPKPRGDAKGTGPDRVAQQGETQPRGTGLGTRTPNAPGVNLNASIDASPLRERAIETIVVHAKHENAQVRGASVEAASLIIRRLRPVVEAGLSDENAGVRAIAASVVGRMKVKELVTPARPLLRDSAGEVRAAAMLAVAGNGARIDMTPLAEMLLNDSSPWVSRQAAFVLGELRNPSALPLLQNAARVRVPAVDPAQQKPLQLILTEAMIKLGDDSQKPTVRAALFPDSTGNLEGLALAAQILGEVGDQESKGQLINLVQFKDARGAAFPGEIRLAAATSLAKMGTSDGALSLADEYLTSEDERLRMQAAGLYALVPNRKGWNRLATLLDDPNPLVRVAAAAGVLRGN